MSLQVHQLIPDAILSSTVIVCVKVTCITTGISSCPGSGDRSATIDYSVRVSLKVTGTSVSQLSVAVTVGWQQVLHPH